MGISVPPGARDWHDFQWPVTLGCSRVSEGCRHCTAEEITARAYGLERYATMKHGKAKWTGIVEPRPGALDALTWVAKPARIFIGSNSDLFHPAIEDEYIDSVISTADANRHHMFGVLTKHADRLAEFFAERFVPPNVCLGVTVEAPAYLSRLDALMTISHATVRWVSCEPLLARVSLLGYLGHHQLNWVVTGPETGADKRPCDPDWIRLLRDECRAAEVPFFTQYLIDGERHREYPELAPGTGS